MEKDYYQVLGVPKDASLKQIKIAYRTLASKFHPDHNENTEEQFREIQEAYEMLSASKRGDESFSRVIKRRLCPERTARSLRAVLSPCLSGRLGSCYVANTYFSQNDSVPNGSVISPLNLHRRDGHSRRLDSAIGRGHKVRPYGTRYVGRDLVSLP